ncbi:CheW protein [Thalassoporum mexicanum PCC 7367]|uniref:chemotaxis protein CheW n=1 Tax=Thalassoporum mexicanum TaxID=3457544 RepID=UPI00029FD057|nr:chemotaxis protein CheW [Pseudanabaena sp. PCC 7367]AFY71600.1 CheW protein [Pseudanabaena sp. PCC 7367]
MSNDCWNQIGVWGDRTCPELANFTHCRNCSVYAKAGRGLLERAVTTAYMQEWTNLLAKPSAERGGQRSGETIAVAIFRLGREWLALPANLFKQVTSPEPVHILPHRSNQILRGIVNVRGQLLLCISLADLLHVEKATPTIANSSIAKTTTTDVAISKDVSPIVYRRLLVIAQQGEDWAFEVDEFYGIQRFASEELRSAPTVVASATETYTRCIVPWQARNVNYLDAQRLLQTLTEKIL